MYPYNQTPTGLTRLKDATGAGKLGPALVQGYRESPHSQGQDQHIARSTLQRVRTVTESEVDLGGTGGTGGAWCQG